MPGFIDARCVKCNRKIGWFGEMKDMPRCKCGHLPDKESLEADDKQMAEFEEYLLNRKKGKNETN